MLFVTVGWDIQVLGMDIYNNVVPTSAHKVIIDVI